MGIGFGSRERSVVKNARSLKREVGSVQDEDLSVKHGAGEFRGSGSFQRQRTLEVEVAVEDA